MFDSGLPAFTAAESPVSTPFWTILLDILPYSVKSAEGIQRVPEPAKRVRMETFPARARFNGWKRHVHFRDGNFSVRLLVVWDGTDVQIAEAFNQALSHQDRIAREEKRPSEAVGKEARLRQRLAVLGANGDWATDVEFLDVCDRVCG